MNRVVFFGTPDYVIPIPEALKNAGHEIVAVATQPPKPVGRKQILTSSPVAQWAEKHKVPVLVNFRDLIRKSSTPRSLRLEEGTPCEAEIGVLASFGRIIPNDVIEFFPYGILNIHPSLLPKYRGASPVQAAIIAGDKETGVTIIKLDEEVDHGPIVAQFTEEIRADDTTGTLRERLFKKGAEELLKILPHYVVRRLEPKEQEHKTATFTTLIKKSDGFTKLQDNVSTERFIRAMSPWPVAWTEIKVTSNKKQVTRKLRILKAHVGDGKLIFDQVQLEGKKPVTWKQFKQGYPEAKFV